MQFILLFEWIQHILIVLQMLFLVQYYNIFLYKWINMKKLCVLSIWRDFYHRMPLCIWLIYRELYKSQDLIVCIIKKRKMNHQQLYCLDIIVIMQNSVLQQISVLREIAPQELDQAITSLDAETMVALSSLFNWFVCFSVHYTCNCDNVKTEG